MKWTLMDVRVRVKGEDGKTHTLVFMDTEEVRSWGVGLLDAVGEMMLEMEPTDDGRSDVPQTIEARDEFQCAGCGREILLGERAVMFGKGEYWHETCFATYLGGLE